jgi:Mn-dependent DtxR family transcriptional regulator
MPPQSVTDGPMVKRVWNSKRAKHATGAVRPNPLSDLTRVDDYLEVVYDLINRKGYARPSDIAEQLSVRTASVTGMLQRLDRMGLIRYERYRGLTLTPNGEQRAKTIQRTHLTILKFLRVFGIEEKVAKEDAEGIEHHVNKTTIERISRFVEYVNKHPAWFQAFVETLK